MKDVLDLVLLQLTLQGDVLTLRQAMESIIAFGGKGSGKTSATGRTLINAFLKNNFGGIVFCVKAEEKDNWIKLCTAAGRLDDLIIFGPRSGHGFNFLDFERTLNADEGGGIVHNIARTLVKVIKKGYQSTSGPETDGAFWQSSLDYMVVNLIRLVKLTRTKLRLEDMHAILISAPRSYDDLNDPEFVENSLCLQLIKQAATMINSLNESDEIDDMAKELQKVEAFFLRVFLNLSEKTRSVVEQMFLAFSSQLLDAPLKQMFCEDTTITPNDCIKGKIILVDLPVLLYQDMGILGSMLMKTVWMKAMSRRTISANSRPVFLYLDECQYLVDAQSDTDFLSTARSYRVSTVYLTQNIPNLNVHLGANGSQDKVKALLGNFGIKVFLANTCDVTNDYAAKLIGKDKYLAQNSSSSLGQDISTSAGVAERFEDMVPAHMFARLLTGGPANNYTVQGYLHRQGEPLQQTDRNFARVEFSQDDHNQTNNKTN